MDLWYRQKYSRHYVPPYVSVISLIVMILFTVLILYIADQVNKQNYQLDPLAVENHLR